MKDYRGKIKVEAEPHPPSVQITDNVINEAVNFIRAYRTVSGNEKLFLTFYCPF